MVPGALDFDASKFTVIFTLFLMFCLESSFLALVQRYLLTCLVLTVACIRPHHVLPCALATLSMCSRAITSQGNISVSLCIYDHLS